MSNNLIMKNIQISSNGQIALAEAEKSHYFLDVFVETHVLESKYKDAPGTEPSLLGPYYEEDSPLLEGSSVVIPQRPDEPGDKLKFFGNVSSIKWTDWQHKSGMVAG